MEDLTLKTTVFLVFLYAYPWVGTHWNAQRDPGRQACEDFTLIKEKSYDQHTHVTIATILSPSQIDQVSRHMSFPRSNHHFVSAFSPGFILHSDQLIPTLPRTSRNCAITNSSSRLHFFLLHACLGRDSSASELLLCPGSPLRVEPVNPVPVTLPYFP